MRNSMFIDLSLHLPWLQPNFNEFFMVFNTYQLNTILLRLYLLYFGLLYYKDYSNSKVGKKFQKTSITEITN